MTYELIDWIPFFAKSNLEPVLLLLRRILRPVDYRDDMLYANSDLR